MEPWCQRARIGAWIGWAVVCAVLFALAGRTMAWSAALFALERTGSPAGLVIALMLGVPFAIGFVLHLAVGVDYVTVFGERSLAQMAFSLRKARAREVFAQLRERVQEAQARRREP